MGKRDTYREHIDWADVERAYGNGGYHGTHVMSVGRQ